jgi:hypothetical protein
MPCISLFEVKEAIMKKQSKLELYLRLHPEALIKHEGDLVFYHPEYPDGTVNTTMVEVKDRRDGKLIRREDDTFIYLWCRQCKHEQRIRRQGFEVWSIFTAATMVEVELLCARCDRHLCTFLMTQDGLYLIHNIRKPTD